MCEERPVDFLRQTLVTGVVRMEVVDVGELVFNSVRVARVSDGFVEVEEAVELPALSDELVDFDALFVDLRGGVLREGRPGRVTQVSGRLR